MNKRSGFPYRIAVEYSEEDEAYIARVPALQGCAAHGDTAEEAAREVLAAAGGILASMKRHGEGSPPSDLAAEHSGNIRLRLPRYLHARLAREANAEGVSLNQLMVARLSEGAVSALAAPARKLSGHLRTFRVRESGRSSGFMAAEDGPDFEYGQAEVTRKQLGGLRPRKRAPREQAAPPTVSTAAAPPPTSSKRRRRA